MTLPRRVLPNTTYLAFNRFRQWTWPISCKAVQCMRIELPEPGSVISMKARDGS